MKIKVLGIWYNVERGPVPGEDFGMVDYRRQLILVDEALGPEEFAETVLHEVFHLVSRATLSQLVEEQVFKISRAFFSVITDGENIDLIATLMGGEWEWEEEQTDES